MSVVEVKVGTRHFQLACEDGEEDHLAGLAKEVDKKLNNLGKQMRTNNESLLLLLTSLMMQDELNEFRKNMENDDKIKNLVKSKDEELADVINTVSDYLEIIISRMEGQENNGEQNSEQSTESSADKTSSAEKTAGVAAN